MKLYADIKTENVEKVEYTRIEYSTLIDWNRIFPSNSDFFITNTIKVPHEKKQKVITNKYPITFDIETNPDGTSWLQQFTINTTTIVSHKWTDTMQIFDIIVDKMKEVSDSNNYAIATVSIANLGFEFQYIRKRLTNYVQIFATNSRKPLFVTTERMHFFDPLRLSNSSLEKLSDLYNLPTKKAFKIINGKKIMNLDYEIYRTSKWLLSDDEREYVCNDTEILADFWRWCIKNYIENGYDIPLTATGIDRNTVSQLAIEELTITREYTNKKTGKKKKCKFPNELGKKIPKLFPPTLKEYDDLMMMTFVGGYTKSNIEYTGIELSNVNGGDFTSSYPSVMMFEKFPMSPFKNDPNIKSFTTKNGKTIHGTSIDDIIRQGKNGLASIQKIRFKELQAKTTHSIQSVSKCYEYKECNKSTSRMIDKYHCIVDNGRIFYSQQLTVSLTELDVETFSEFYEWESCEIIERKIATKDFLPDYIRKAVVIYYQIKAQLKKLGLEDTTEYMIAKAMVNALYGMMCEKLHIIQDVCDPMCDTIDTWYKTQQPVNVDYLYAFATMGITGDFTDPEKFKKAIKKMDRIYKGSELTNKFLSPYWAVYTTSSARRNLLKNVYKCHRDVIYCDTDSMYFIDNGKAREVMKEWNDFIHKRNTELIDEWNTNHGFDRKKYDMEIDVDIKAEYLKNTHGILLENLIDLGEFDILNPYGNYTKFKTLGCKRYLKTGLVKDKKTGELKNETIATIAGLPKGALLEYAEKLKKDPYEIFDDNMCIPNCKKAHCYIDEPYETTITDPQGNTETMCELSAIVLQNVDFSMKLSGMYKMLITAVSDVMRFSTSELLENVRILNENIKKEVLIKGGKND